ncbi:hypothetical protein H5410_024461 [Solanum commersonii]|uniref:SWIM-type domain-containing protein n=1 Tax=Solanum commersonii TaxID=4109 RepID=A0A9J5ZM29_SOLCO|nr:hypothetical protein H5410_024461 [Solanum commersonii]
MDKFIDPSTVYTPKDKAEEVLKVHDVALTYMQAWKAKEKAIKFVRGDPTESYAKLPASGQGLIQNVIPSTVDMRAVVDGPKWYIVNLNTKMCSCGRFQNDKIPCGHGIAVLRYRRLHEIDYCSPFYSLKNFQDTYDILVEPLPCESTWDIPSYVSEPKLMPPDLKRTIGRPQLERWKEFADVKFKRSKVTCSRCPQVGHNMTTCSNYPMKKK